MKKTYLPLLFLVSIYLIISASSTVLAQESINFSFERTGPNHSVLVLPLWHPVIKELEQNDSLDSNIVLGFKNYPTNLYLVRQNLYLVRNNSTFGSFLGA